MTNIDAYQQYQQNAINCAGRGQLTLMLYNGAVNFVRQGIQHVNNKKIEGAHKSILRAQEIIAYLDETLAPEYEVSHSLALLYDYMNRRLMEANVKKDRTILEEVLGLLEVLRDTWAEAIKLAGAGSCEQPLAI